MFIRPLLTFCFAIFALAAQVSADGFGSFTKDELNPPGGVKRIVDPTGGAPVSKVELFTIPAGYCNPKRYDASGPDSDCYDNSTRAQMVQQRQKQPAEA